MSRPLIMSYRPDAPEMCFDGRKRRTRRIWKPEWSLVSGFGSGRTQLEVCRSYNDYDGPAIWRVGDPITIKASRTGKGLGRVLCTGLRVEHVQDITEEEARLEGVEPVFAITGSDATGKANYYRLSFELVWRRLYPRGPKSWDANPLVVAIAFEPEVPPC